MNKELNKALSEAANKTNLSEREVFDEAIKLGLVGIMEGLSHPQNIQYNAWKVEQSFIAFRPHVDFKMLAEIAVVQSLLQKEMFASEPFDDVLTAFYEIAFISNTNNKGQFMTPKSVADLLSHLTTTDEELEGEFSFADPCCGTGTLIMSPLKRIYNKLGKRGLSGKTVYINDIDPALLRIAVYQIMFNSFRLDAPIGTFDVRCSDAIVDYERSHEFLVWVCLAMKPAEREQTAALAVLHHLKHNEVDLSAMR